MWPRIFPATWSRTWRFFENVFAFCQEGWKYARQTAYDISIVGPRRKSRKRKPYWLNIEALETRVVPTNAVWIGTNSSYPQWSNTSNWYGGNIPSATYDNVIIENGVSAGFQTVDDISSLSLDTLQTTFPLDVASGKLLTLGISSGSGRFSIVNYAAFLDIVSV
jgi:hypothetical protein